MISVLFILFLFLSCCHFLESRVTIAIWASLAGFGLYGLDTNRFRTAGSRARARPESISSRLSIFLYRGKFVAGK